MPVPYPIQNTFVVVLNPYMNNPPNAETVEPVYDVNEFILTNESVSKKGVIEAATVAFASPTNKPTFAASVER